MVAFNVKALTLAMTCAHCKEHRQAIWLQNVPVLNLLWFVSSWEWMEVLRQDSLYNLIPPI